jgi:hypothetical protein
MSETNERITMAAEAEGDAELVRRVEEIIGEQIRTGS